ncbi:hypothetical protein FOG51_03299 [Hanseniaspora uvarum]|jgi:cytidine deaminase|uniref:cytidine deaminase n=1 Tax=Hanseniaspora uvarum TaxID=29833 RepID=A0A1E5RVE6_HANUV|nr:hypothetical protein FOG48_01616 [Hanseniaspora uvarum]KKA03640.1 Cytidine deaminase [Hanseniaspora uvarum DSM 2768]KAF0271918.1 hypothetical protein FOG51_03299 [Hanseniaspora uvarum]KAF0278123.1 hypothetical protein FOG50_01018 [Hanseniaspora uvarum]OEJ90748.1 putative cytidine deaminase [Hanseniaspora uvarum]
MDAELYNLIKNTYQYQDRAYCPYSKFNVGASILIKEEEHDKKYKFIGGCNVENASYGGAICAERTAFTKAVSEGYTSGFIRIGVTGGENSDAFVSPCGICRQFMREFVDPKKFQIVMCRARTSKEKSIDSFEYIENYKEGSDYLIKTLEELLPLSFGPDDL